jgi:hypothetical protein
VETPHPVTQHLAHRLAQHSLTTSWLDMPGEQTDLCKVHVSTSGAASPGSRSGNPAAAGSADAAASATGGDMFACIAQNQGPNSTSSEGGSRLKVFARSGRKRHARRTDGMQLQFVAIGENCGNLAQIATARWADSTSAASNKCKWPRSRGWACL